MRRTARAIRSGVRRYPRSIISSVFDSSTRPGSTPTETVAQLGEHELAIAWIGHASVLCRLGPMNLVVDPVLSDRIGPRIARRTFGPSRLTPPPVSADDLRGIDLLLITHAHFDHLDRPTLKQIASSHTRVVTPQGVANLIPPGFASVHTLKPGSETELARASIQALKPRHWGARTILDRRRGVNSYLIEADGRRVLFAGDTAFTHVFDHLQQIDIAVFGIGAYEPWDHMHATPEQVWRMFKAMDARYLLPIHHSTFELSDEPAHEPRNRLLKAAGDQSHRILDAQPGEIFALPDRTHDNQVDPPTCKSHRDPCQDL